MNGAGNEPDSGHRLGCNLLKPVPRRCNCDDDQTFTLADRLDHPLAQEQRDGVHPERVVEWLFAHLH